jgi:hypothetical protein
MIWVIIGGFILGALLGEQQIIGLSMVLALGLALSALFGPLVAVFVCAFILYQGDKKGWN